jgi:transcriptional regulator with XRE-family HTH domain
MDQESAPQFRAYIVQLRVQRKLSIRGLAKRAGINSGQLTRIEDGTRPIPKVATLKALAEALEIPVSDMLAQAGYTALYDLLGLSPYLCANYCKLPEDGRTSLDNYLKQLIEEHGLDPRGPRGREDETSEPEQD